MENLVTDGYFNEISLLSMEQTRLITFPGVFTCLHLLYDLWEN